MNIGSLFPRHARKLSIRVVNPISELNRKENNDEKTVIDLAFEP